MKKQTPQFGILSLALLPVFLSPVFLGLRIGSAQNAEWASGILPFIPYVIVFCWIITRRFDRHSVFRKFPFRGSLWIGSLLGYSYGLLLAIGFCLGVFTKPLPNELAAAIAACIGGTAVSTACFGAAGAVLGMFAGWGYCYARSLREKITGESTIRPGQASFRKGTQETTAKVA